MESSAERIVRVGWVAKGVVYLIVGLLAFDLARRDYQSTDADQRGALEVVSSAPWGRGLVFLVSVGLVLFAIWELWSAIAGDESDLLGRAERIGRAGLSLGYGLLAVTGLQVAWRGSAGSGGGSSSEGSDGRVPTSPQGITETLFSWPAGRVLVVLLGAATIAVGGYQMWKAAREGMLDGVDTAGIHPRALSVLEWAGRFGATARALVVLIIGWLFAVAAWQYDSEEAAGLDDALRALVDAPSGRGLLVVCAAGLFTSGVFEIVTFRRRSIDQP